MLLRRRGGAMLACFLGAVVASASSGCRVCDLSPCEAAGFRIVIESEAPSLPTGSYVVSIETEVNRLTVQCSIGAARSAKPCETLDDSDDDPAAFEVLPQVMRDDDGTPRELWLELFRHDDDVEGPREVRLSVAIDGAPRIEAQWEPVYQRDQPGGPGCGWCESTSEQRIAIAADATNQPK